MTGVAVAQTAATGAQIQMPEPIAVNLTGYTIHQTVDFGGHVVGVKGSGAMYNTMVNVQSGPRMLNQTVEMHALPGKQEFAVRYTLRSQQRLRRRSNQRDKTDFLEGQAL